MTGDVTPVSINPNFRATLFGRADPDDLAACDLSTQEDLASNAWALLAAPRNGPVIRLSDQTTRSPTGQRDITVLQVLNDNMPFLLDSTLAELTAQGLDPSLVAHPILAVARSAAGDLVRFAGEAATAAQGLRHESLLHIHLPRMADATSRAQLIEALTRVYADVAAAVEDWVAMRGRVFEAAHSYRLAPPPLPAGETAEAIAFLDWLGADNFTFLGVREYRFPDGDAAADPVEGSGLGLLRDPSIRVLRRGHELVTMTPEIRAFLARPQALIITKANARSRIHRRVHFDYIGVKLFGPNGEIEGELRLIGLFTAHLYASMARSVPWLRRRIDAVLARAGFDPSSYAGRALLAVLEDYPRDELFQVSDDTLFGFALEIMNLAERPRVRALVRADAFDRFVSVLVFVPKDRYDSTVRQRIGVFLAEAFNGRVSAAYPTYPEGPLARTHFIIGRHDGATPRPDRAMLERGIAGIVRTWTDKLREALSADAQGRQAFARHAEAFSAAYREAFTPEEAARDIAVLDRLTDAAPRAVDVYRRTRDQNDRANLRLFSRGASLPLSERVPMLEHLGFRVVNERTYRIAGEAADGVWLHDMTLERPNGAPIAVEAMQAPLQATLLAVFDGLTDSDGFNRLVLDAELSWREAALLRTFARYLRQLRVPFGQDYLATTLARHHAIAARLVEMFKVRFDPESPRSPAIEAAIGAEIEAALAGVDNLDDDRILRRFLNLVRATQRTNFFQTDANGRARFAITLKFACHEVAFMPLPRPLFEIFVHSPRVEGLHLRFGRVARGGLRWSDRPQDYRTEVLGLVKAQQVKNAVIVPVGAKGGFSPQRLPSPSDRAAWIAEGTESYRIFVRSLLELTDNIADGAVVPPARTVRHDGDDPYLVVAADKGTATFSDVANALSLEAGFWLGDAFASGGSHGYDHKVMGITAKGAWESVKRHFREIGRDIQSQDFTAVGIGDMSGDVFGNGALLSRHMRLVAAFDHRHIFLDPNPDAARSWRERARLFAQPRSNWSDYDPAALSPGGGVFARTLKTIPLSSAVQAALGFEQAEATPAELLSAILKAPVDLLWFGGIGTYVRASGETEDEVADRANDGIRVTGAAIRAKVVAEGANLGATQRGRIEAALAGVRLNTDAIDNSAGVNTSDLEVNIKIALAAPVADGALDEPGRNALLASMTDEVGPLVLRNNYLQSLALSLAERRATADLGFARRMMRKLEDDKRLDRAVEFLPDEAGLASRALAGRGLTRPESAVLLAYAKLTLYADLLAGPFLDDPYLARELVRYFPAALQSRFPQAVAGHKLRREIIATTLANAIVNRAGPYVVTRLIDETGTDVAGIAAAYAVVRDSFGLMALNAAIDGLDGRVAGAAQLGLYAASQDVLMGRMVWFLRHARLDAGLGATVARFQGKIANIAADLTGMLPDAAARDLAARTAAHIAAGVPEPLAAQVARLALLEEAPDIILVAEAASVPIRTVATTHFELADRFGIAGLSAAAAGLKADGRYERLALDRARIGIAGAHRALTAAVIASGRDVTAWSARAGAANSRTAAALAAAAAEPASLASLTVAAGLLADLAG